MTTALDRLATALDRLPIGPRLEFMACVSVLGDAATLRDISFSWPDKTIFLAKLTLKEIADDPIFVSYHVRSSEFRVTIGIAESRDQSLFAATGRLPLIGDCVENSLLPPFMATASELNGTS